MSDIEAAEKSHDEVIAEIWQHVPARLRLRGLTPEERIEGLTADQIVQIVAALPPEIQEEIARKLRH